jgi:hypothetical protein
VITKYFGGSDPVNMLLISLSLNFFFKMRKRIEISPAIQKQKRSKRAKISRNEKFDVTIGQLNIEKCS